VRGRIKFEYTGLMRCGECGRMITAESQRQYIYYRCTKKGTKCTQKFLRVEALLTQIKESLKKVYIDNNTKNKIFKRFDFYAKRESKASISLSGQIQEKIAEIDSKIQKLIELFISQEISAEEYQSLKAKLLNEKQDLREKLGQIEKSSGGWLEQAKDFITTCNRIGSVAWQENPLPLRDFLKTVGSNFILKDLTLYFSYNKPFDIVAKLQGVEDWRA
ncbi:MAG: zinc ribbon domain-containing protein, partial [Candidatus Omnitrophota bacterium]